MKFVVDENIPNLDETFAHHGDVIRCNGRQIGRRDLQGADVLLVRSITRVDEQLLRQTGIRFVGSTTIGTDHIDTTWLEANEIAWAHAPGCNADAAAQYTLALMWLACDRLGKEFKRQSVGIIGRGNVGRRLEHLLKVLGIKVMSCDPPLRDRGEQGLVSMDEACGNSIISLHTPLTTQGPYATLNLFNLQQLAKLQAGTLLVNASRGGVIEKSELSGQLQSGRLHAALDVWPDEPFIDAKLLQAVTVATPHVAGYSLEGKTAGTDMIYQRFCRIFGLAPQAKSEAEYSPVELEYPTSISGTELMGYAIQSSCQVERDDKSLRQLCKPGNLDQRVQIDGLRTDYPERQDFKSYLVRGASDSDASCLQQLGFRIG